MKDKIRSQYNTHKEWSCQLHYDNLRVLDEEELGEEVPSYSTVRRFMRCHGMVRKKQPGKFSPGQLLADDRLQKREVRSFELEHVGALYHLDRRGLQTLGILVNRTLPFSPYQNGKQERFWGVIEGRLVNMLPRDRSLTLKTLNDATMAWMEIEYNQAVHRDIGVSPIDRFLSDPSVLRKSPTYEELRMAFRLRVTRRLRKTDCTVSIDGVRFEIPSAYRGFALITGDPGYGKSIALRLVFERISAVRDLTVGIFSRPQSNIADFYRELAHLFGVDLKVSNRFGGYTALRAKWKRHLESSQLRPVLFVDEAQEMPTVTLNELRLLSSMHFDCQTILTVLLAGDGRLTDRFRSSDLAPLGSRMRNRLLMGPITNEEMVVFLRDKTYMRVYRFHSEKI